MLIGKSLWYIRRKFLTRVRPDKTKTDKIAKGAMCTDLLKESCKWQGRVLCLFYIQSREHAKGNVFEIRNEKNPSIISFSIELQFDRCSIQYIFNLDLKFLGDFVPTDTFAAKRHTSAGLVEIS